MVTFFSGRKEGNHSLTDHEGGGGGLEKNYEPTNCQ